MSYSKTFAFSFITTLAAIPVSAHVVTNNTAQRTTLDVGVSATWRSDGAVGNRELWRIPGAMMGGESWPVEAGLVIDEANLALTHALDDQLYGVIKAGIHSGGGDHSGVELEHVYLGWQGGEQWPWLRVEAGRMSAIFSPAIAEHATTRLFSEAPMALDVFLGRHFHDEGARVMLTPLAGVSAGVEYWRGRNFPATAGDEGGSVDVFARYDWQGEQLSLGVGGWWMQADSALRSDHRYSGGHQHNNAFTPLVTDIRFSGETRLGGLNGRLGWSFTEALNWTVEGEWMQSEAEGELQDGVRMATIDSDYVGGWLQTTLTWKRHRFSLRGEELILENNLTGAGAPQLANDAGLLNDGENPYRVSASWHWQWHQRLALRIEAVKDESLLRDESRFAVGLVWRERVWSR